MYKTLIFGWMAFGPKQSSGVLKDWLFKKRFFIDIYGSMKNLEHSWNHFSSFTAKKSFQIIENVLHTKKKCEELLRVYLFDKIVSY